MDVPPDALRHNYHPREPDGGGRESDPRLRCVQRPTCFHWLVPGLAANHLPEGQGCSCASCGPIVAVKGRQRTDLLARLDRAGLSPIPVNLTE